MENPGIERVLLLCSVGWWMSLFGWLSGCSFIFVVGVILCLVLGWSVVVWLDMVYVGETLLVLVLAYLIVCADVMVYY